MWVDPNSRKYHETCARRSYFVVLTLIQRHSKICTGVGWRFVGI